MQILRAAEDYLEAMLMMQQRHGYIRSIDIAEHLGVTKPSVTYTTKRLRENGYITMPEGPGLGIELVDDIAEKFPFQGMKPRWSYHEDGSPIDR